MLTVLDNSVQLMQAKLDLGHGILVKTVIQGLMGSEPNTTTLLLYSTLETNKPQRTP